MMVLGRTPGDLGGDEGSAEINVFLAQAAVDVFGQEFAAQLLGENEKTVSVKKETFYSAPLSFNSK